MTRVDMSINTSISLSHFPNLKFGSSPFLICKIRGGKVCTGIFLHFCIPCLTKHILTQFCLIYTFLQAVSPDIIIDVYVILPNIFIFVSQFLDGEQNAT